MNILDLVEEIAVKAVVTLGGFSIAAFILWDFFSKLPVK